MDGRLPGKALAPSRNRNVMTIILFRLLLGKEREREERDKEIKKKERPRVEHCHRGSTEEKETFRKT